MKTIILDIDAGLDGRRIENILKKDMRLSHSVINRLKRTDAAVLLNGSSVKVIAKVSSGDRLTVNIPGNSTENIDAVEMALDIIYEDEDIIAVNKPRNMAVHPSRNHQRDTLANGLMHHFGSDGEIHIITRLDRDTSGVVIVAKNTHAAKLLTEEMKNGNILKEYAAVINGSPAPEKGIVDAPVKRDKGIKRAVSPDGKAAVTEYEVMSEGELSSVRLFPKTGRTHQLRVHMSYIGCPIYGDEMYGAPQKGERTRLHCRKIEFRHPRTGEHTEIIAPLPEDMECLI